MHRIPAKDGRTDGETARRRGASIRGSRGESPTDRPRRRPQREMEEKIHECDTGAMVGRRTRTRMSRRRRPSAVWRISNARSFCGSHLSSRESPRTEVRNRGKILPPYMSRCVESQTKAFLALEHELNSDFKGVGRRASFQFRPFVLAHGYLVRTSKAE